MSASEKSSLFRAEVFDAKKNTWLGEIVLIRPTSFAFLTGVTALFVVVMLTYLFWGEYTRKAKAIGYIVPNEGLIKVAPQQAGIVAALRVREGQMVVKGEVLAVLNTERSTSNGDAQAEITKQLSARRALLTQDQDKLATLFAQQARALSDRAANVRSELIQVDRNIELQQQRVRITENILATQRRLNQEKFISDLALQQKEQERLVDLSNLENLKRGRTVLLRDLASIDADAKALPLKRENEFSQVSKSLASLEQDRIEVESRRETMLTAPQSGIVTALATDKGKLALAGQPLLSIIPLGSTLQADLYIPARAAGFVREGAATLLQYQAFPYQKFGTHEGKVTKVSRTAVAATELPFPAQQGELYYVATVAIAKQTVTAYGKEQPLQSGMLVDANILLDRRTLFEWVFEPLYSISGRWRS
jgi:membrane fusion protein